MVTVGLSNDFDPKKKSLEYNYEICIDNTSMGIFICPNKDAYSRYVILRPAFPWKYLAIEEVEAKGECE